MKNTQIDCVIAMLKNHEPVNSVALFGKGITRLSAIIYKLRLRGYDIETRQAHNNGLAYYSLVEGWNQKKANLEKGCV
ncbi:MAG: helix-turn-helix domain-containing protein [Methylococcaceae bacterium]